MTPHPTGEDLHPRIRHGGPEPYRIEMISPPLSNTVLKQRNGLDDNVIAGYQAPFYPKNFRPRHRSALVVTIVPVQKGKEGGGVHKKVHV